MSATVLDKENYISLETFRKNNEPVRTPVWFVLENGIIYVITKEKTGKVKRIRNNTQVNFAPCNFRGKITGKWVSGIANEVSGDESKVAINLRNKKYGFKAKIAQFASRGKGDFVVFSIKPKLD